MDDIDLPRSLLRSRLAPCGLDCGRCLVRAGGEVQQAAARLRQALTGFATHAQRFAGFQPIFAQYAEFAAVNDHLAQAGCQGCRSGTCLHPTCRVKDCAPSRGVDFCAECPDFPCLATGFDAALEARWRANNQRIAAMGASAYYLEILQKPRY